MEWWVILLIVGGGAALVFFLFIGTYNTLVRLRNQVKNAWAQIDVQLKRRHDLIPNLLETVKGYMKHERETLQGVTDARARAMSAQTVGDKGRAEGALSGAMGNFMLAVENYPELKANQNFLALQEELASTENKIAFSRQAYNDQVLQYNNKIEMFPSNVLAGMFSFKTADLFELTDPKERAVPKVDFS